MNFQNPEIEVIKFAAVDVMTSSPDGNTDPTLPSKDSTHGTPSGWVWG